MNFFQPCFLFFSFSLTVRCNVYPWWTTNLLSANFTKRSNTLKQFVGKLTTNCLSVFDHFVGLVLKGLRSQYSNDNTMKNGLLKVGPFISCWRSYARLLYWHCKVGRIQTEVGRTFETAKSQSSNHCQQRILREIRAPIQVLTTRACARLIALKFSFRANVPFLNHCRGAKTVRTKRVWTYTRTKTNIVS